MASNFLLLSLPENRRGRGPGSRSGCASGRWEEAARKGGTQRRCGEWQGAPGRALYSRRAGGLHGALRLSGRRTSGQQGSRGPRRSQGAQTSRGTRAPRLVGRRGPRVSEVLGCRGPGACGGPGVRNDAGAVSAAGVPTPGREPPVPAPPGNSRGKRPAPTRADALRAARARLGALKERTPSGPGSRAAPRRRSRATPSPAPERGRAGEEREAPALRPRSSLQGCGASAPTGSAAGGRQATSPRGRGLCWGRDPVCGWAGLVGRKGCWMGGACADGRGLRRPRRVSAASRRMALAQPRPRLQTRSPTGLHGCERWMSVPLSDREARQWRRLEAARGTLGSGLAIDPARRARSR